MSTTITRLLALSTASGARYLMAGAVLGAIVALSLNMALSSAEPRTPSAPAPVGGGMPTTDGETKSPYDVPVGTCLNWTESDGSDMTAVDCEEAHVFEVTEIIQVGNEFPQDAKRPSVEKWRKIAAKKCEDGVEEYLNDPLDPEGKYSITALLPNQPEWDSGERTLRCGLWRIGPGGSLQATTDSAKDQSQSDIWVQGTCLGLDGTSVGDPVSCDRPHSFEMIAIIKLSNHFKDDGYPLVKKQNAYLDKVCNKQVQQYTGGIDLEKKNLIATWDTRTKASWEAGSVFVNCKVARLLKDESGFAPITGSISKNPPPEEKKSDSDSGDNKSGDSSDDSDGGSGDDATNDEGPGNGNGNGNGNGGDGAGDSGNSSTDEGDGQAADATDETTPADN